MIVFSVKNLSFSYDFSIKSIKKSDVDKNVSSAFATMEEAFILKNINFDINKGDFVSICGKNGSGKSTLLKILARILKPQKGEILIYNKNWLTIDNKTYYKHISYVEQQTNTNIPLKVRDIILTGRYIFTNFIYSYSKSDYKIVDEIIERLNLGNLKEKNYNELSGGEKQKVLIAKALCQTKEIILLDEPTSSLDIHNRIEILNILKDLKNEGSTIIVVNHNINEVYKYSDKVIFLNDGNAIYGDKTQIMNAEFLSNLYNSNIDKLEYNNNTYFVY